MTADKGKEIDVKLISDEKHRKSEKGWDTAWIAWSYDLFMQLERKSFEYIGQTL